MFGFKLTIQGNKQLELAKQVKKKQELEEMRKKEQEAQKQARASLDKRTLELLEMNSADYTKTLYIKELRDIVFSKNRRHEVDDGRLFSEYFANKVQVPNQLKESRRLQERENETELELQIVRR